MDNFLSISDLSIYQFHEVLDLAGQVKAQPQRFKEKLKDKVLAMIFEKPSLRTRMTFQVGMLQLGGHAIYLGPSDIQLGQRESTHDVGKNLERWVDMIMIRTFDHQIAVDLAEYTNIPVINALTDALHPCQGMADFLTIKERHHDLTNLTLAYIGDGNNVCHSLLFAAAKAGSRMKVATPPGYEPDPNIVTKAEEAGAETGFRLEISHDPAEAVQEAHAVYTDTWTSMGQEAEKKERAQIFSHYQVNSDLMTKAQPQAIFMHCLPAHRGEEVTDEVIDSPQSVVFDQAENRLHLQKAIMLLLMGIKK
ncbi:MAG: ornithine carbamoyltransferase [Candidatus Aminicenantes bacterium]|nr:ornithine carbamoyltransferase [Candidatus Aminicenantes bacterium]